MSGQYASGRWYQRPSDTYAGLGHSLKTRAEGAGRGGGQVGCPGRRRCRFIWLSLRSGFVLYESTPRMTVSHTTADIGSHRFYRFAVATSSTDLVSTRQADWVGPNRNSYFHYILWPWTLSAFVLYEINVSVGGNLLDRLRDGRAGKCILGYDYFQCLLKIISLCIHLLWCNNKSTWSKLDLSCYRLFNFKNKNCRNFDKSCSVSCCVIGKSTLQFICNVCNQSKALSPLPRQMVVLHILDTQLKSLHPKQLKMICDMWQFLRSVW